MNPHDDIAPPHLDRGPLGHLPATLEWIGGRDGCLRLLDQTLLPLETRSLDCPDVETVWEAIRSLRVRGAPAIGVAAAYGLCLGTRPSQNLSRDAFLARVQDVGRYLCACRPTAVNLAWAVKRISECAAQCPATESPAIWTAMLVEAHRMWQADAETCRRIGEVGADLVPDGGGVLTHCNAGALATVAYGTALALLYMAHQRGRRFRVWADETRPLLQGARLTAYELNAAGLDVTVLCDGAAAGLLRSGRVQLVVTGADRIAANGDTANKIGTYGLAIAARHHGVPFYVAAPCSTFDLAVPSGDAIPIEQRSDTEIRNCFGRTIVPPGVACHNPAFDVTPAELIAGIVTERGLVLPVTAEVIGRLVPSTA